ncbi:hypothetical protein L3081_14975 [Colwellia sp. MSW7]|uniref:Uncharacterized protein n=1 Tax=Colwellia maritima TaxID=2912588 RepID=A0ABS9X2I9_9GAMM|nr:hypothetical protein [Colwellia maritima]MCI2284451.1 hypothetical protein [Colwellia maritima]
MNSFYHQLSTYSRKAILPCACLILSSYIPRGQTQEVAETEIEEVPAATTPFSKKTPVIIETQVKGSQEQPNVIYIMPWQGTEKPVIIEGNNSKITMPNFKPINPKEFKKQTTTFYKLAVKNTNKTVNQ